MILVKFGKMGQKVTEYAFNDGATLRSAANQIGFAILTSEDIILNGQVKNPIVLDSLLANGDIVLTAVKTANKAIQVGRIGEVLIERTVAPGQSLFHVLSSANRMPNANEQIWLHRGVERPIEVTTSHMDIRDQDNYIVEERKPLSTIKRMIETFDADSVYEDEDIHALAVRIIETVRNYDRTNR